VTNEDHYRVLVVDDDPDVAELTRTVLERRAGCEVIALNDPRLVASTIEDFQPDVVVTDIEMPGMTGIELLRLVRAARPGLPVVVMTAHISAEYAIGALRGQADEFLTKPIASADLAATVLRLAAMWRQTSEDVKELSRAAEVQRGLLPAQLVDLGGYQLAGGCTPARVVGGDFFDWYPTPDGVAFTLADVMGKGIGAAILAATVRAVLRSELRGADLAAEFAAAASRLDDDLAPAGSFVTTFHGALEVESGVIRYIDAGHGLSLHVRADGRVTRLATTSLPIGLQLEGGAYDGWREHVVTLAPGDTLVCASDGVLDLYDGTLASLEQVEKVSRAAPDAQSIVDTLLDLAGSAAPDDVTVVALRRDPDHQPTGSDEGSAA
jgi:sigma-B regulation protein RsbU (phosphoserine phosphatase)